ncbi:MAG TPA: hypothetical protein VH307_29610 [Streptosporangiaceae bacterium]|nr:hypothetical protein [Streptosporangiaceae bacterium]
MYRAPAIVAVVRWIAALAVGLVDQQGERDCDRTGHMDGGQAGRGLRGQNRA